jgi:hypothetical protein
MPRKHTPVESDPRQTSIVNNEKINTINDGDDDDDDDDSPTCGASVMTDYVRDDHVRSDQHIRGS